jgi:hypothetical protein
MSLGIIHEETNAIIDKALGMDMVRAWQGATFMVNGDEEGMALLGKTTRRVPLKFQSRSQDVSSRGASSSCNVHPPVNQRARRIESAVASQDGCFSTSLR